MDKRFGERSFICPICSIAAHHTWLYGAALDVPLETPKPSLECEDSYNSVDSIKLKNYRNSALKISNVTFSLCSYCNDMSIWLKGELLYPQKMEWSIPKDLPEFCHDDFKEACKVGIISPKAGLAFLRACIEKLIYSVTKEKNLNKAIQLLIDKYSITPTVQMACDFIRIKGNETLHPPFYFEGNSVLHMYNDDTEEVFQSALKLINIIVNELITTKKEVEELYQSLPENKRRQIKIRG